MSSITLSTNFAQVANSGQKVRVQFGNAEFSFNANGGNPFALDIGDDYKTAKTLYARAVDAQTCVIEVLDVNVPPAISSGQIEQGGTPISGSNPLPVTIVGAGVTLDVDDTNIIATQEANAVWSVKDAEVLAKLEEIKNLLNKTIITKPLLIEALLSNTQSPLLIVAMGLDPAKQYSYAGDGYPLPLTISRNGANLVVIADNTSAADIPATAVVISATQLN